MSPDNTTIVDPYIKQSFGNSADVRVESYADDGPRKIRKGGGSVSTGNELLRYLGMVLKRNINYGHFRYLFYPLKEANLQRTSAIYNRLGTSESPTPHCKVYLFNPELHGAWECLQDMKCHFDLHCYYKVKAIQ